MQTSITVTTEITQSLKTEHYCMILTKGVHCSVKCTGLHNIGLNWYCGSGLCLSLLQITNSMSVIRVTAHSLISNCWKQKYAFTHPLVLVDPLKGLLWQWVVHVPQLRHHGTQQLGHTHTHTRSLLKHIRKTQLLLFSNYNMCIWDFEFNMQNRWLTWWKMKCGKTSHEVWMRCTG